MRLSLRPLAKRERKGHPRWQLWSQAGDGGGEAEKWSQPCSCGSQKRSPWLRQGLKDEVWRQRERSHASQFSITMTDSWGSNSQRQGLLWPMVLEGLVHDHPIPLLWVPSGNGGRCRMARKQETEEEAGVPQPPHVSPGLTSQQHQAGDPAFSTQAFGEHVRFKL